MDEFELSLGEVAERVGRSKPAVSNRLRLLELPEDVLWMVERGELAEGHARAVLAVPDHEGAQKLAGGSSRRACRCAPPRGPRGRGAAPQAAHGGPVDPALAERARVRALERADRLPGAGHRGRSRSSSPTRSQLEELAEALESL